MREYEMNLYQVKTTDGYEWVAEYPDLKGCVGGGFTIEEAIKEAEENKVLYLETLKSMGKELPQPRIHKESKASGKLSLRLSKSLHKDLAEISNEEGVSMNQYAIEAISEKIGKDKSTTAFENVISSMTEKIKFKFEPETYGKPTAKIRGVNFENNSNARIYVKGVNLELNKIEFKTYPNVKKQVQIEATQNIKLTDISDNKIVFMVERNVGFEPQALFGLCVQVKVEFFIGEDTLTNFENDLSKLEKYANDKANILITQSGVGNCLSLLIAQISSFGGGLPIITPPVLEE